MEKLKIYLSPAHKIEWIKYLEYIAQGIYNDFGETCVLKGGTSLSLLYGILRYSIDLDYNLMHEIDISSSIEKSGENFIKEYFNINTIINTTINARKSLCGLTYHIHIKITDPDIRLAYTPLKIDTRTLGQISNNNDSYLRDPRNIVVINNICTYNITTLADLKLNTITGTEASKKE